MFSAKTWSAETRVPGRFSTVKAMLTLSGSDSGRTLVAAANQEKAGVVGRIVFDAGGQHLSSVARAACSLAIAAELLSPGSITCLTLPAVS